MRLAKTIKHLLIYLILIEWHGGLLFVTPAAGGFGWKRNPLEFWRKCQFQNRGIKNKFSNFSEI